MSTKAATEKPQKASHLPSPESLPLDGYSRWLGLKPFMPFSRETLRKLEIAGRFPLRQHLSKRCAVWPNRELHRWFADPVNYRSGA